MTNVTLSRFPSKLFFLSCLSFNIISPNFNVFVHGVSFCQNDITKLLHIEKEIPHFHKRGILYHLND